VRLKALEWQVLQALPDAEAVVTDHGVYKLGEFGLKGDLEEWKQEILSQAKRFLSHLEIGAQVVLPTGRTGLIKRVLFGDMPPSLEVICQDGQELEVSAALVEFSGFSAPRKAWSDEIARARKLKRGKRPVGRPRKNAVPA